MAKVSFTKLGLKKQDKTEVRVFNEQTIEIKQYLPVDEKLSLIERVIKYAHDENNFPNPLKVKAITLIEIINCYTNISFTDKQREDVSKLYDLLTENQLANLILETIPDGELAELYVAIDDTIEAYYKYRNSVLGIMDIVSQDYSNLEYDATNIQQKLADPKNLAVLRETLTKMG